MDSAESIPDSNKLEETSTAQEEKASTEGPSGDNNETTKEPSEAAEIREKPAEFSEEPPKGQELIPVKTESSEGENVCECDKYICRCGEPDPEPACICTKDNLEVNTSVNITLKIKGGELQKVKKKKVCICAPPAPEPDYCLRICQQVDPIECVCTADSSESSEMEPEPEPEPDLRRFVILDKIPCNYSNQLEILKKVLAVMAEDGFPLAKLPDCHKLPHFKLWMQLRCGKHWTMDDRETLLLRSRDYWRHTDDCCTRKVKVKRAEKFNQEFTWAQASYVKDLAAEKVEAHYRKVKQANIGDGREFFPTTVSYELPTLNFRDCFFAYSAAKEEGCNAFRPWYPHEIKDLSKRKSCM